MRNTGKSTLSTYRDDMREGLALLGAEVKQLRGVLYGDTLHPEGVLAALQRQLGALTEQVGALAESVRGLGERERVARARWRWIVIGAAGTGALTTGGLFALAERVVSML